MGVCTSNSCLYVIIVWYKLETVFQESQLLVVGSTWKGVGVDSVLGGFVGSRRELVFFSLFDEKSIFL